jgi:cbb3-type cytochrome oxidase subunit 3
MDLLQLVTDIRPLMVVWVFAVFLAVVLWAWSPRRKAIYEDCGRIPLRDDR